ncbi:MAG: hypothetical protein HY306_13805 [Nitrosomonadales bacterium]|nr:hypothetical protein [Nitrosomonadales bacterium]
MRNLPFFSPQRKWNGIIDCLAALMLLWPAMGWGSDNKIPSWGLDAGFSLLHFDYREFKDAGSQFNRESGFIPGVALTLGRANKDWDVLGRFSYNSGTVGYDGKTQSGLPILTSTEETLYDFSAQMGRRFFLGPEIIPVRIYGEIGYRQWKRDIHSTPVATGLLETYQWNYASAGATLPIIQVPSATVSIDAKLTSAFNSSIAVNSRGLYDTANLTLGSRNGFRISLPISLPRQEGFQFNIVPFFEQWSFGRSNVESLTQHGLIVGTVFEPRSETKTTGIQIRLIKSI